MKPIEIAKGIYEVGASDWNVRDLHGFSTERGTTYNAFLIVDEKIALIDTVKKEFTGRLLDRIAAVVDPRRIDYVISNHTELDHSGGLPAVLQAIGQKVPVYCSKMGRKNLSRHFREDFRLRAVEDGEVLSLGTRTLKFIETRMIHWPDSMFTWLQEDRILFSSDAFGQHYAGTEKFDDRIGGEILLHAKKYFANILWLYAPLVKGLLDRMAQMGLKIDMICPDHGILWRKNPERILEAYGRWCRQEPENRAAVIYDSMWGSTEMMAEAIVAGLEAAGIPARPLHLRHCHRSDVVTEAFDARAVIVGSPTLNNGLFPTLGDFLTYFKGLRPQNKLAAAFGSFGWSGEATRLIHDELAGMDLELVEPPLKIQYVPDQAGLESCFEFGRSIALAMKEDK